MIKIEDIKSPEDILQFMNDNIKYGWIDKDNNKHIDTMKEFRKKYITMSLEDTLRYNLGCCIEQVYLMHYLLDNLNIQNKMFCCRIYEPNDYNNLDEDEHMHCFILYYLNNKVYHLEHPNFDKKGIYEFNSEEDAINSIVKYYIELSGGIDRPTTQFYDVPTGLSFKEFNNYINSLDTINNNQLSIYNLKDRPEFIEEIAILTQNEWGKKNLSKEEFDIKIQNKINKIKNNFNNPNYCKLILIKNSTLIGFISIFEYDCDERLDLSPWYATIYIKKEFRNNGFSKLLNDAILKEAKKRGFKKIYLKSELNNYYEKFGAKYLENLNDKEKLYYFDL